MLVTPSFVCMCIIILVIRVLRITLVLVACDVIYEKHGIGSSPLMDEVSVCVFTAF
jgi:hypothetical protein